ncbi:hypothetical protein AYJ57_19540 [Salipiger sp. CCB-MM3]|uniref:hypothetical protein n=1 Tax=Salipiger sp. CCB-MM3 TaxID=1792508 RepID=UPI00080A9C22|nr:hypothetical protein [Salipiger sp. CCB-MM3]ANT62579.1 hypothetical protein AYJ57_19540 [Salipiger sp. CCB-MM3]
MIGGNENKDRARRVGAGGGFVIACLVGLIGVVGGVILWLSDASLLVVLLAYLGFPAIIIVTLFVMVSVRTKVERLKKPEKATVEQVKKKKNHGHAAD